MSVLPTPENRKKASKRKPLETAFKSKYEGSSQKLGSLKKKKMEEALSYLGAYINWLTVLRDDTGRIESFGRNL